MNDIIIEQVIKKKAIEFGNSSHIILPKRLKDKTIYVLVVMENVIRPKIHKDRVKIINGKMYYQAEITNEAGTHGFWIRKDKIKNIFTRN